MASYDWENPLCLVSNTGDTGFTVNEEVLGRLADIKAPVVVVAIAGLYRTGKSYLMNLLANSKKGFALGASVQSMTKGIWIWCRPHPERAGVCLALLDTEGLGDVEKGDEENDNWIFTLAVLLSSTLVYNSLGTIDQDALDKLYFITSLCEHVKVKHDGEEDGTDFDMFFPNFVWAVRDFSLALQLDGIAVTSDEYLEHTLKLRRGTSRKVSDYNLPRECIRNYFPSRRCFTFPMPVEQREKLYNLGSVCEDELDPDFVTTNGEFTRHIYTSAKCKSIDGCQMNGSTLANLTNSYVNAIQTGAIPCIQSAFDMATTLGNKQAVEESVDLYKSSMVASVKLPTETPEELAALHHKCEKEAIALFLDRAITDGEHKFQEAMMVAVHDEYDQMTQLNATKSQDKSMSILHQLYQPVTSAVQRGDYAVPGGYMTYEDHMRKLETSYHQSPGKGIKALEVLYTFLKEKDIERVSIMQADQKLSKAEKMAEEERKRAEEGARDQKAKEETQTIIDKTIAAKMQSYEENLQQMERKMDEQRRAMEQEWEEMLEKRIKEYELLKEQGCEKQAKVMKQEIEIFEEKKTSKWPGKLKFMAKKLANIFLPVLPIVAEFVR